MPNWPSLLWPQSQIAPVESTTIELFWLAPIAVTPLRPAIGAVGAVDERYGVGLGGKQPGTARPWRESGDLEHRLELTRNLRQRTGARNRRRYKVANA